MAATSLAPEFQLQPSKYLILLLLLSHITATVISFSCEFSLAIMTALIILIIGSFMYQLQNYYQKRIVSFRKTEENWQLQTHSGIIYQAKLQSSTVCTKALIILIFTVENKYLSLAVPVFKDMLPMQEFKRLRKCLLEYR